MLGGIAAGAQAADPGKLSLDLANSLPSPVDNRAAMVRQIVGTRNAAGLSGVSASAPSDAPRFRVLVRTNAPFSTALRNRYARGGATIGRTFSRLGTAVLEATPEQILALTNDPTVVSISPDRAVISTAELDVNRRAVGADMVPSGGGTDGGTTDGGGSRSRVPGMSVAVIDSGVAPVPDIAGSIVGFKDFVNEQTAAYDDFGHGTHVAGIIAGNGASSSDATAFRTYNGIAPGVGIVGVKVLAADGTGNISNVIAALDWCIANRAAYNIRVINLSLGGGVFESYQTDPLCLAAERAVAAGIVVVTSAGNWGGVYGGVGSPANDPQVITVGASNTRGTVGRNDDVITTYSGRGPSRFDLAFKPDVIAPGNRIVSLRAPGSTIDTRFPETRVDPSEYRTLTGGENVPSAYTRLSGTSMAAPMVSAAAIRMLQVNPGLLPNGVKAGLMYSAQLLNGYDPVRNETLFYDPYTQGAGEINLPGAVEMASLMTPWGLSATPSRVTNIGGVFFAWSGLHIPYLLERTSGIWTNNLTTDAGTWSAAWSNGQLWVSGGRWTENLVWAGNSVWGGAHDDPKLAFMVPADPDLIWASQQTWGGPNSAIRYSNLFLHGEALGIPVGASAVWAGNSVWGGAHDDPKLSFLIQGDDLLNPFGTIP
jgi:serine protease AprX